jgi:hypothetical protein
MGRRKGKIGEKEREEMKRKGPYLRPMSLFASKTVFAGFSAT